MKGRPDDEPEAARAPRAKAADTLRVTPLTGAGNAPERVIVTVRRDHYAPKGLRIRSWPSPRSFVAVLGPGDAERLARDPWVASVQPVGSPGGRR